MIVGLLHGSTKGAPALAGAERMTIEEVVRKVLLDEYADVIREAVKAVAAASARYAGRVRQRGQPEGETFN
jgi:hypothetical protein